MMIRDWPAQDHCPMCVVADLPILRTPSQLPQFLQSTQREPLSPSEALRALRLARCRRCLRSARDAATPWRRCRRCLRLHQPFGEPIVDLLSLQFLDTLQALSDRERSCLCCCSHGASCNRRDPGSQHLGRARCFRSPVFLWPVLGAKEPLFPFGTAPARLSQH